MRGKEETDSQAVIIAIYHQQRTFPNNKNKHGKR